jgi:hypothetical protein
MTITLATAGGDVEVSFTTSVDHDKASSEISEYALFVDSAEQFRVRWRNSSSDRGVISLRYLVTGLSAASHTFEIHWRSVGGTEVRQSAATWSAGRHFYLVEHP